MNNLGGKSKPTGEGQNKKSEDKTPKDGHAQPERFKFSQFDKPKETGSSGKVQQALPPAPIIRDGQTLYLMEKIVTESDDLSEFKCRWKGYSDKDDTWEIASRIPVVIMNEYNRGVNMLESRQDMTQRHKSNRLDLASIYKYQGVDILMCCGDKQYVIDGI